MTKSDTNLNCYVSCSLSEIRSCLGLSFPCSREERSLRPNPDETGVSKVRCEKVWMRKVFTEDVNLKIFGVIEQA